MCAEHSSGRSHVPDPTGPAATDRGQQPRRRIGLCDHVDGNLGPTAGPRHRPRGHHQYQTEPSRRGQL